jgi:hypothetical protein
MLKSPDARPRRRSRLPRLVCRVRAAAMRLASLLPWANACRTDGGKSAGDGPTARADPTTDADACLAQAESLLGGSQDGGAERLLRAAPRLAKTRRQLVELTLRAATKDGDFIELAARGDQARDAGNWADGERRYAEALALYPAHPGYTVQYAHCLKEQQKFAEAEIHYRSALALGAPPADVTEHLEFVAMRQGYSETGAGNALTARQGNGGMMDAPPTRQDVDLAYTLLTGEAPYTADLLDILRTQKSVRDVFVWVIGQSDFLAHNRDLLRLIAGGSLRL